MHLKLTLENFKSPSPFNPFYPLFFSLAPVVQGCYLFTSGVPDQAPEVVMGYIQEASSGRGVCLHTVLFNVDDYDCNGAIPGRYANITRTAECLRNMAHVTAGRFQWFRETGESSHHAVQVSYTTCLSFYHASGLYIITLCQYQTVW